MKYYKEKPHIAIEYIETWYIIRKYWNFMVPQKLFFGRNGNPGSRLDYSALTWSLPCMHASCLHTGYALPCLLVLVLLEWPCSLTCPLLLSRVFLCSVVLSYMLACWIIRSRFVSYTHCSTSILVSAWDLEILILEFPYYLAPPSRYASVGMRLSLTT